VTNPISAHRYGLTPVVPRVRPKPPYHPLLPPLVSFFTPVANAFS
jgi:hypothetical protein